MILYNTSFYIDSTIEPEFLAWIKSDVLTATKNFGFSEPLLTRILIAMEPGCSSFALQFTADDIAIIERWENECRPTLFAEMQRRWNQRALAFSTPMEVLEI